MDPNATLTLILDAVRAGELAAASEHAGNLSTWIRNGGSRPTNVPDGINLDALLAVLLAAGTDDELTDEDEDEDDELTDEERLAQQ